jgi:hypothetical protein
MPMIAKPPHRRESGGLRRAERLAALPPAFLLAACGGGTQDGSGGTDGGVFTIRNVRVGTADGQAPQSFMTFATDIDGNRESDIIILPGNFPPSPDIKFHPVVILNDGDAGEVSETAFARGYVHPREVVTADFNNDGILDAFIAAHGYDTDPFPGEPNGLILSTGTGTLIDASGLLPALSDFTHSAAATDVDGDGFADIYVGNIWGRDNVKPYLLLNQGGTAFQKVDLDPAIFDWNQASPGANNKYTSAQFADLDGDGQEELILGMDAYSRSLILRFDAAANDFVLERELPDAVFGAASITIDVQAGDINGDGLPDIVMSQTSAEPFYTGRAIQLLVQKPDGSFEDRSAGGISGFDDDAQWIIFISLTDFDGDGDIDIIGALGSGGYLVLDNDGDGTFQDRRGGEAEPGSEAYALAIDYATGGIFGVNHDGRLGDLAVSGELNVVHFMA